MTWRPEDLLAGYRDASGPAPDAAARVRARLDELGPPGSAAAEAVELGPAPTSARRRQGLRALGVAAAAIAAAVGLSWWLHSEQALRSETADRSLASDQRADEMSEQSTESRRPHLSAEPLDPAAPEPGSPLPPTNSDVDLTSVGSPRGSSSPAPGRPRGPRASRSSPSDDLGSPPEKTDSSHRGDTEPDSLAAETQRIAHARARLSAGDPRGALEQLDDYDRRYPRGALREEADAVRAMARCRSNPRAAGPELSTFLRRHPRSLFETQVRNACAISTPSDSPLHQPPTTPDIHRPR